MMRVVLDTNLRRPKFGLPNDVIDDIVWPVTSLHQNLAVERKRARRNSADALSSPLELVRGPRRSQSRP